MPRERGKQVRLGSTKASTTTEMSYGNHDCPFRRDVPYRRVYNGVIDGRVPGERGDNGRWRMAEADLPAIAEALGLTDHATA